MSAAKSCRRYSVRCHYEFTGADGPVRPNRACANFPTIIYRQTAHRGRPPGRLETGLAPHLMQKPCHCEASAHTGCGNPRFPTTVLPPAAPFLSAAKEREERTPPKPMVKESFPRLKRRLYRPPFALRIGLCKIYAVLSYSLCVPIRDALCACAGLAKQGKPLRLLRGGVRARRPTQSQKLDSVGADDPVAVPKISMLPCGCRMKF